MEKDYDSKAFGSSVRRIRYTPNIFYILLTAEWFEQVEVDLMQEAGVRYGVPCGLMLRS